MNRTFISAIGVLEVLKSSSIRGIMVPYGELEQYSTEGKLDLVRPIISYVAL